MTDALINITAVLCTIYVLAVLCLMMGLFRGGPRLNRAMPMVSVIIPARNEENNIVSCLTALKLQ
ncbi:MAG: hypothetical protein O3B73_17610, partial [bacterium]|nr:hypothetical protein [bacterium]